MDISLEAHHCEVALISSYSSVRIADVILHCQVTLDIENLYRSHYSFP